LGRRRTLASLKRRSFAVIARWVPH
jgi:hypothetical protein